MAQITRSVEGLVPKTRGIVQPMITGVGFDAVAKFADGFFGGFVQGFGMNLPYVGRISLIDVLNFVAHNKGFHFKRKEGYLAVLSAKLLQTGVNVGPRLSGLNANVTTGNIPATGANI